MPNTDVMRQPQTPRELFSVFNRLALQGFGGVLPVAQRALVERERWMSGEQFLELLSVSQVLPGPNIVNLALIFGDRTLGWRGALAATAGLLLAPLCIVLALAWAARYGQAWPAFNNALHGMGVVAAGLVLYTAVKLAPSLRKNALGWPLCALWAGFTAVAVGLLHWPLVWVVLGLGAPSVGLAWWRLRDSMQR
jgi:chromate transporter